MQFVLHAPRLTRVKGCRLSASPVRCASVALRNLGDGLAGAYAGGSWALAGGRELSSVAADPFLDSAEQDLRELIP